MKYKEKESFYFYLKQKFEIHGILNESNKENKIISFARYICSANLNRRELLDLIRGMV